MLLIPWNVYLNSADLQYYFHGMYTVYQWNYGCNSMELHSPLLNRSTLFFQVLGLRPETKQKILVLELRPSFQVSGLRPSEICFHLIKFHGLYVEIKLHVFFNKNRLISPLEKLFSEKIVSYSFYWQKYIFEFSIFFLYFSIFSGLRNFEISNLETLTFPGTSCRSGVCFIWSNIWNI